ncbi:GNAT family N-acetyltransferase [Nitratireductor aquimarinus]|uniref:GNAT family N-acetyltransferase n=1 Tax=Nitratireductor aquimarinus TaxID=889300 RepID=UPI00398F318C
MTVLFYENIGHSPAWPLVITALAELDAKGLATRPMDPPSQYDPCMVSFDSEGEPNGFVCYRYDARGSSWFILLAYVVPDLRRSGVHTAMFKALADRARARGDITSIDCGTDVHNKAAQAAFKAQGRIPIAIMFKYVIKPHVDGKDPLDGTADA